MNRLLLLRHGLTQGNVCRWYYGALDLPLCDEGLSALRQAASDGLYPPFSPDHVLTSGLRRTEQTLSVLYGSLAHEAWPDLREVNFGIFEGQSYDELKDTPAYQSWLSGDWFHNVPPSGESFAQAEARILFAFSRMQTLSGDVLAIVHGGTILTILQALFPEEHKTAYDWQPKPGGGYLIDLPAHTFFPCGLF